MGGGVGGFEVRRMPVEVYLEESKSRSFSSSLDRGESTRNIRWSKGYVQAEARAYLSINSSDLIVFLLFFPNVSASLLLRPRAIACSYLYFKLL